MKKRTKITALLMALLILFNSAGAAVISHTCLFSGKSKIDFFQGKACCKEKKDQGQESQGVSFKKSKCCKTESGFLVSKVFNSAVKVKTLAKMAITSLGIPFEFSFSSNYNFTSSFQAFYPTKPPLGKQNRLYLRNSVFII